MRPVIQAIGISKAFDGVQALRHIDLSVDRGDFFGIFGPNGAGKTTLLRVLSGQLRATEGDAFVAGINVKDSVEVKRHIGIVPEAEMLPSFLTLEEFLQFVARIRGIAYDRVEYWLGYLELSDKRNALCKDLSKGTKQKLMLASAFIHEPKILFLDEPFINLDPMYQRKMREYLMRYVKAGNTIFLCSHILEIAEKLCTTVAIINDGRIIRSGTLDELQVCEGESLGDIFCRSVEECDDGDVSKDSMDDKGTA